MNTYKHHNFLSKLLLASLMVMLAGVISACGFKLRGAVNLPYKTVFITGSMSTELRQNLTRGIEVGTKAKVVTVAKGAELTIEIIQDQNSKQILSYNSSGQITAYRLVNLVKFRAFDALGNELISDSDIYLTRDMDFSISTILAAEMMELELVSSMRQDIATQILRRVSALQVNTLKK